MESRHRPDGLARRADRLSVDRDGGIRRRAIDLELPQLGAQLDDRPPGIIDRVRCCILRQGDERLVGLQRFNRTAKRAIGLGDTLVGLAMPYIASAYGIFLVRQGFRSIPPEYDEAAMLDGAGRVRTLWHVLVPMIRPHLAAFSVVSVIYHWNEFLWPLVATSSNSNRVLAVGLQSFTRASESGAEWGLICAGTLIVVAPLLLLFVLFQRVFIQSFTQSGLKG